MSGYLYLCNAAPYSNLERRFASLQNSFDTLSGWNGLGVSLPLVEGKVFGVGIAAGYVD